MNIVNRGVSLDAGLSVRSTEEKQALLSKIDELTPWYSYYDFGDGIVTRSPWENINQKHFEDRAERLFSALAEYVCPSNCSLLDVGCADGYFTIEAAKRGYKSVTGIDFRKDSIERAKFAAEMLNINNSNFYIGNVYDRKDVGETSFDVVICQGLFYHLSDPVRALKNVRAATGRVCFFAGWTVIRQDAVFYVRSEEVADIRNGDQSICFVPTAAGICKTLELVGYSHVIDINPWAEEPDWTSDQGDWREYIAMI